MSRIGKAPIKLSSDLNVTVKDSIVTVKGKLGELNYTLLPGITETGKKVLMLLGTVGLTSIYAILGAGYYFKVTGIPMLILVVLAIACYAMTLAPITWVVISELIPKQS